MYGYIYKISINNKNSKLHGCYYIGQRKSITTDDNYYGSGKVIKDYIKKYGHDTLYKEILSICESFEELNTQENFYIGDLYKNDSFYQGGKCLNLRAGGMQAGYNEQTYKKICEANRNGKNVGRKHSEETKQKLSIQKLGNKNPNYHKIPWNKGIKYTAEQKKKICEANKTKPTYGHLNKKHSEETKQRISEVQKKFKWWTNGIIETRSLLCPNDFHAGRLKKC